MGIVVKHKDTNRIIFYLKGAEDIMKVKVPKEYKHVIEEYCGDLAREGLRTLVITQKLLSQEKYEKWAKSYDDAKTEMGNREKSMLAVLEELEVNMQYLGVTGVED